MKPSFTLWLSVAAAMLAIAGAVASHHRLVETREAIARLKEGKPGHNSFFHAPAAGCPPGTKSVPKMFELQDKPVPGCYNPDGDGSIDVLRPHEGHARRHYDPHRPRPARAPQAAGGGHENMSGFLRHSSMRGKRTVQVVPKTWSKRCPKHGEWEATAYNQLCPACKAEKKR